jgi:hypothetical protein
MKKLLIIGLGMVVLSPIFSQQTLMYRGSVVRTEGAAGSHIKTSYTVPLVPEYIPPPKLPWDTSTVTFFGPWTLDNDVLGYFSREDQGASLIAAGALDWRVASNGWSGAVDSDHHPHVVTAGVDSSGVLSTTQAVRYRMIEDVGSQPPSDPYYLPQNTRVYDGSDSLSAWLYYVVKRKGSGWDDLLASDEYKMSGVNAGYGEEMDIIRVGDPGLNYVKHKIMGKGVSGEDSMRIVTYPRADAEGYNSYTTLIHQLRKNSDTTKVWNMAIEDTSWTAITLHLIMNREYGVGDSISVFEYFIDGQKAMELNHTPLESGNPWGNLGDGGVLVRDGTEDCTVDGWQISYHWGGDGLTRPDNGHADLLYDMVWKGEFLDVVYEGVGITRFDPWPWDEPCPQPPWPHYWKNGAW